MNPVLVGTISRITVQGLVDVNFSYRQNDSCNLLALLSRQDRDDLADC